ncbi:hypothetical protein B0H14DRAFT_2649343 [Mycena olivaceomarginata]|nr:hypothetical protein B0H14DRAFT_2649343 [Mycena olivaceomarginata]
MKFTLSCLTLLSVVYAAAVPPAADRVVLRRGIHGRKPHQRRAYALPPVYRHLRHYHGWNQRCCIDLAFDLDNLVSSFGPSPARYIMRMDALTLDPLRGGQAPLCSRVSRISASLPVPQWAPECCLQTTSSHLTDAPSSKPSYMHTLSVVL